MADQEAQGKSGNGRDNQEDRKHRLVQGDVRHYPVLVGLAGPLKDRRFTIEKEVVTVGRDMQADIILKDSSAFRYHARVIYTNAENYGDRPECRILDGGSATGTFVNGERVGPEGRVLTDKDRVQMGRSVFAFLVQNHMDQSIDQAIAEMVTHDSLTGLFDAVNFRQVLNVEIERARRYEEELSLLALDVDGYRQIVSHRGRDTAHRVLKAIGQFLCARLRCCDVAARLGDDHIVVLLPETAVEGARVLGQRLAEGIAQMQVKAPSGSTFSITVCVGIAGFDSSVRGVDQFLDRANMALQKAKDQGPGRVHWMD